MRTALNALVLFGFVLVLAGPLGAQDTRLLRGLESSDFRVRAQAVIALGTRGEASARTYLEAALDDPHPAVRSAAISGLARLRSTSSIAALRRLQRDPIASVRQQATQVVARLERSLEAEETRAAPRVHTASGFYPAVSVVPTEDQIAWSTVRYAVVLRDLVNRTTFSNRAIETQFRTEVARRLKLMRQVAVFASEEALGPQSRKQLERFRVPTVNMTGNIVSLQRKPHPTEIAMKCQVSLLVLDHGQNLKGMLNGTATAQEPGPQTQSATQEERLASQALGGAVGSAMSSAPQALARAVSR